MERGRTKVTGRPVIDRKGIGKQSIFSVAHDVVIAGMEFISRCSTPLDQDHPQAGHYE